MTILVRLQHPEVSIEHHLERVQLAPVERQGAEGSAPDCCAVTGRHLAHHMRWRGFDTEQLLVYHDTTRAPMSVISL